MDVSITSPAARADLTLSATARSLGKYWCAVRADQALAAMPMRVPNDVDFEAYRTEVQQVLSRLGDVKSGELFDDQGQRFFVQQLTHANRGKTARTPKVYLLRS